MPNAPAGNVFICDSSNFSPMPTISPDLSGHRCQTDRAPMLVGTLLPVILSVFRALGPALRPDVPVEQRRTAPRPPGFLALSCVLATQAREPHLGTVSPQDDDRHSPSHRGSRGPLCD